MHVRSPHVHPAVAALAAAALFGASTPLAKLLVGEVPPLLLAGLLYLGSGIGLTALLLLRHAMRRELPPARPRWMMQTRDAMWLLGAIVTGGIAGPALLMAGLARANAASASLLLNFEGVFTALIAWLVFREGTDRRMVVGMAAIVAGGVLLSWQPGAAAGSNGALLIVGACACWAVDNNLTRKVSNHDALEVAALKGMVAGICNTALAIGAGAAWPGADIGAPALLLGFAGYGISLALFVVALRTLGTARTSAYFSVAPLFGVALALALWPTAPGLLFWAASGLMAIGIALHMRERHEHRHTHAETAHSHRHVHDEHHRHEHAYAWNPAEPHVHTHVHTQLTHRHAHYPDIHHRHAHEEP